MYYAIFHLLTEINKMVIWPLFNIYMNLYNNILCLFSLNLFFIIAETNKFS